jgi:hypothetical protein
MNKLLEPPPGIVETVLRYECPRCGNNCQCGVPYIAKTVRAAEYAAKNPTASVREIADETGVGHGTAQRAKAGVPHGTPTTGRDGRTYPAVKPSATKSDRPATRQSAIKPEVPEQRENLILKAHQAMKPVIALMQRMTPQQRGRSSVSKR